MSVATSPRALLIITENDTLIDGADVRGLVEMAVVAEANGIDSVMMSEHVVLGPAANALGLPDNPRAYAAPGNQDPRMPWPSSLITLAAIAARTSTLRLVAGAVITPLRHPLVLAKEFATLDQFSEGRLVVLPTVSWHEQEFAALGVPFHQRGEILDEQLAVWEAIWAGDPVAFHGRHYDFAEVHVQPRAYRPGGPTLWFGGSTLHERVLQRLVRHGHGFNPFGAPTADELGRLSEALDAAGRSLDSIEMVGGVRAVFDDHTSPADLDRAMDAVPEQLANGFTTICVKPSMFIDSIEELPAFCKRVVHVLESLAADRDRPGQPAPADPADPAEPAERYIER